MSTTSERREADRLQEQAEQLAAAAEAMSERASGMYGRFAGGQPLLVGHHSYRSALRDRSRADSATRRAIEKRAEAEQAQRKAARAKDVADLADIEGARTRPWQRPDFRPGDVVTVRDHRRDLALTGTYTVKRANTKTLTLDGGGGGWDDPRRTYDRVLSRTRDGVTVTDPGTLDNPAPAVDEEPAAPRFTAGQHISLDYSDGSVSTVRVTRVSRFRLTYVCSDGVDEGVDTTLWRTWEESMARYRPATPAEAEKFEARYRPAPVNYL